MTDPRDLFIISLIGIICWLIANIIPIVVLAIAGFSALDILISAVVANVFWFKWATRD